MTLDATDDWLVRYLAGVTLSNLFDRGPSQASGDLSKAALDHFGAVARHREVPNALARTATIALAQRDVATARSAIERARTVAPGREDYAFTYARILGQQGEFAAARAALLPLVRPSNTDSVRNAAQSLITYLGNLEASRQPRTSRSTPAGTPAGGTTQTLTRAEENAASQPAPRSIPVYRTTKADEQRFEGTLERIECPEKGGPVFHVRVSEVPSALKATSFDAVDFITYRPDLTGSIGCGPLKSAMRVYTTVRVTASGEKLLIALEFLPI